MSNVNTLTLFEGVLNNDELIALTGNYYYKGHNKAKVKIEYYTYANEWGNHKHEKYFKTLENACKWYKQNMPDRVVLQGAFWLSEDGGEEHKHLKELINKDYGTAIEQMTEQEKQDAIDEWESLTLYCELA